MAKLGNDQVLMVSLRKDVPYIKPNILIRKKKNLYPIKASAGKSAFTGGTYGSVRNALVLHITLGSYRNHKKPSGHITLSFQRLAKFGVQTCPFVPPLVLNSHIVF